MGSIEGANLGKPDDNQIAAKAELDEALNKAKGGPGSGGENYKAGETEALAAPFSEMTVDATIENATNLVVSLYTLDPEKSLTEEQYKEISGLLSVLETHITKVPESDDDPEKRNQIHDLIQQLGTYLLEKPSQYDVK